jgi:hypothetical protein
MAYDASAPTLIDNGYWPVPIAPIDFEQEGARGRPPRTSYRLSAGTNYWWGGTLDSIPSQTRNPELMSVFGAATAD